MLPVLALAGGGMIAYKVGKYLLSDQEKEGREKAIKVVTSIHRPILSDLQKKYDELTAIIDNEKYSYYAKIDELESLYNNWKAQEINLQHTIYTLAITSKKTKEVSKAMGINLDAICVKENQGEVNWNPNDFINLMMFAYEASHLNLLLAASPLPLLFFPSGDFLDKLADKKRKKYYTLEYQHQCKVWQEKIDEQQNAIDNKLKKINNVKAENAKDIQKLVNFLIDYIKRYPLENSQYIILKKVIENE